MESTFRSSILTYLKHLFPSFKHTTLSLDSYSLSITHSTRPFSLIHSDVWGSAPNFDTHKSSYYVLFVDDCAHMSWLYFLKPKSEVFSVFVTFYNMLRTHFDATPQTLRSNNGGEYINLAM